MHFTKSSIPAALVRKRKQKYGSIPQESSYRFRSSTSSGRGQPSSTLNNRAVDGGEVENQAIASEDSVAAKTTAVREIRVRRRITVRMSGGGTATTNRIKPKNGPLYHTLVNVHVARTSHDVPWIR
jgi:hypothetical protein